MVRARLLLGRASPGPLNAAAREAPRASGEAMIEMLRTMKVVGMRPLLRLRQAQRLAWPGMINGFYATRIMQTLFHVGFLDEVAEKGSVEPARFAAAHGLDP